VTAQPATAGQQRAEAAGDWTAGRAGPSSWAREVSGGTRYVQIGSTSLNVPIAGADRSYFEGVWKRRMFMLIDFRGQAIADPNLRMPWDFWQTVYGDTVGMFPAVRFGQTGIPAAERQSRLFTVDQWFAVAFPQGWRTSEMLPLIRLQYAGSEQYVV
jgi:hypothetical protein